MPPRLLELFKGTGSVGKVFAANGYKVISVDFDPKYNPTHNTDILEFNYRKYRPGYFRYIWASPPCTQYSHARTTGPPPDFVTADRIVARTIAIIRYLRPQFWFMENPALSKLRHRPVIKTLPRPHQNVVLDYCQFSDWGYRKPTRVWYGGRAKKAHRTIQSVRCPFTLRGCRNTKETPDGRIIHHMHLSGNTHRPTACKEDKYRVPARLVGYLVGPGVFQHIPRD